MEIGKIEIIENHGRLLTKHLITAGLVGATVDFTFDETWVNMAKAYVWTGSDITIVDTQATGVVPPEVLTRPGGPLRVGVYGVDGDKVTPTLWVNLGNILRGCDPSIDPSTDMSLPVWAQIQREMKELKEEVDEELQNGGSVKTVNGVTPDENGNVEVKSVASWNDLEDKPFGMVVGFETLVSGTESFTSGKVSTSSLAYQLMYNFVLNGQLKSGDTIFIEIDGAKYECVLSVEEVNSFGMKYTSMRTEAVGDHEVFVSCTSMGTGNVSAPVPDGAHEVKVCRYGEFNKPLDEQYIPESIMRWEDNHDCCYLTSPSGKNFTLTVDDEGNLTAVEI